MIILDAKGEEHAYTFPRRTHLCVGGPGDRGGEQLNEGSLYPAELLEVRGRDDTERYLIAEVQKVYKSQGVDINDKHIELIARQMLKRVRIERKGDTDSCPGSLIDRHALKRRERRDQEGGRRAATGEEVILGITKASLATDSFLSAASFQETTKVLTDAALEGKVDRLLGLKENVIIGKLIPAATGLRRYRMLEIEPTEPVQRPRRTRSACSTRNSSPPSWGWRPRASRASARRSPRPTSGTISAPTSTSPRAETGARPPPRTEGEES